LDHELLLVMAVIFGAVRVEIGMTWEQQTGRRKRKGSLEWRATQELSGVN
jgi:hypothetical protein